MATAYHIYANTGTGDPINYETPIATVVDGTAWQSTALLPGGDFWFGVRAFDTISGLEEENIDCAVEILLDSAGRDITCRPYAPMGLRAIGGIAGSFKLEWLYAVVDRARRPTGFNVYVGRGNVPDYSRPAAVVEYSTGVMNSFSSSIAGLADGVQYAFGVRACNAVTEEQNTTIVVATARVAGPKPVVALQASAIV